MYRSLLFKKKPDLNSSQRQARARLESVAVPKIKLPSLRRKTISDSRSLHSHLSPRDCLGHARHQGRHNTAEMNGGWSAYVILIIFTSPDRFTGQLPWPARGLEQLPWRVPSGSHRIFRGQRTTLRGWRADEVTHNSQGSTRTLRAHALSPLPGI